MKYDSDTGRFYCVAKQTGYVDAASVAANFVADCLPVISTIKNVYEWNKYREIVNDPTKSQREREAARVLMWIKGAGATLSVAGPLGKLASGLTGKTVGYFLIIKAGQAAEHVAPILEGVDDAIWAGDRVDDASKLGFEGFTAYTPENVIGLTTPTPAPGTNTQQTPGGAATVTDAPATVTSSDAHAPFWGTYTGELVCPVNTVSEYGMTGTFSNPALTIQVWEGGSCRSSTLSILF
jgi:hypothetical protein